MRVGGFAGAELGSGALVLSGATSKLPIKAIARERSRNRRLVIGSHLGLVKDCMRNRVLADAVETESLTRGPLPPDEFRHPRWLPVELLSRYGTGLFYTSAGP